MMKYLQGLSRLVLFLLVLPAALTYLYLRHALVTQEACLVGPSFADSSSFSHVFGIYHPAAAAAVASQFQQTAAIPPSFRWPSVTQVSSTLLLSTKVQSTPSLNHLVFDNVKQQWCLQSARPTATDLQFCFDTSSHGQDTATPPSGLWTASRETSTTKERLSSTHSSIRVSCFRTSANENNNNILPSRSSAMLLTTSSGTTIRRNPNKNHTTTPRYNRNLQQLLARPATCFWLALLTVLAIVYWNRRVPPDAVAMHHGKMVHHGELWRALSGATAHFEPWHLGFNAMSLYALGNELENHEMLLYDSISFWMYNVSLVAVTALLMVLLQHLKQRYYHSSPGVVASGDAHTVGYSGVLFAWMVVTSLERPQTCPIPFFEDVCFTTHSIHIINNNNMIKFNVGPLVQLVVAQFLLPRVSFLGHLAGILAGFALHWHLLPLDLVQPAVLYVAIWLVYQWRGRAGLLPVKGTNGWLLSLHNNHTNINIDVEHHGHVVDARQLKRDRDQQFHRLLQCCVYGLIATVATSLLVVHPFSGMVLAQGLSTVCLTQCVKSHALYLDGSDDPTEHAQEKRRLGILWRGFVVSMVLSIVTNSMTLAAWSLTGTVYNLSGMMMRGGASVITACAILLVRISVEMVALSLAAKQLADIGETGGGIFVHVLGYTVLEHARCFGNQIASIRTRKGWIPFQGQGIVLNNATMAEENSRRMPVAV